MIAKILKTFEPITLPIASSMCPLRAAIIAVTTSGNEVPMATTDKAIAVFDTPNSVAMPMAPLTARCPPMGRPMRPIARKTPARVRLSVRPSISSSGSSTAMPKARCLREK